MTAPIDAAPYVRLRSGGRLRIRRIVQYRVLPHNFEPGRLDLCAYVSTWDGVRRWIPVSRIYIATSTPGGDQPA